jgi:hypothetical protein
MKKHKTGTGKMVKRQSIVVSQLSFPSIQIHALGVLSELGWFQGSGLGVMLFGHDKSG